MTKRYDIGDLIVGHFDSFKSFNVSPLKSWGLWFFILFPVLIGIFFIKNPLNDSAIALIVASLSILAGLLFNLMVSLFSMTSKYGKDDNLYDNSKELFTQVYNNLGFGILIAIFCVSICLIVGTVSFSKTLIFDLVKIIKLDEKNIQEILSYTARFLIYSSCTMFIMTLFMILRKMQALFMREGFRTVSQKKKYSD
jgi:hypothetical protein